MTPLLSWGLDILIVTEARIPESAKRALSRTARGAGFEACFGVSPGSSPTFQVAPGGIAIFARLPLGIRQLYLDKLLHWINRGRLIVTEVIAQSQRIVVIGLYGHPVSHPDYHTNDALFGTTMLWSAEQKAMVLLGGDFNSTISGSCALSGHRDFPMWQVSLNAATTKTRRNETAKGQAIDHLFSNRHLLERCSNPVIRYDLSLSDHFAVQITLEISEEPIIIWRWPTPRKQFAVSVLDPPFEGPTSTYLEWSRTCEDWMGPVFRGGGGQEDDCEF